MSTADIWVGPSSAPDTYRLVSLLGGGGEGEVWRAVLPLSHDGASTVAVKVMHARATADEQERWTRFGHLMRSLTHPGLVRVTEVFLGPGKHREGGAGGSVQAAYVVMDFIDGPTLREWCDEHPDATAAQRLRMLRTVAAALDEMHSGSATRVPVAHGDVKPANIVVRDDGGTVLVDLGLARLADATGMNGRSAPYAAPELRGAAAQATPAADRYAFAVTTAQVLTGVPVPTTQQGWLDVPALEQVLRTSPVTQRRPMLVRRILDAVVAPPDARPGPLGQWLDAAAESLSQVTSGGTALPAIQSQPAAAPAPAFRESPTDPFRAVTATALPPRQPDATHVAPTPRRRRRWPVAVAVLAVLAVLGTTAFLVLRPTTSSPPSTSAAGPTATATTPTTTPTTSFAVIAPTIDPSGSTSASGLPDGPEYLSVIEPVDRQRAAGGAQSGAYSTSGTNYLHAITMDADCYNDDGGDYWLDYDLGRKWSGFTVTVGIRDDSPATSTASFAVVLDSKVIASGKLALGTATPVSVPVTNGLRLRLKMTNAAATQGCGGDPSRTQVVWGDAQLTP